MSWPGLPARRLDQIRQPATAATAPGSSSVIRARYVIVSGPGDGVFVYAPGSTPALGNPPIAWMGGGLVDPYGNVLPSTTGVASSGTFQAGNNLINDDGIFVYSATPALGTLLSGIASSSGNDPFGNPHPFGVWSNIITATNTSGFGTYLSSNANGILLANTPAGLVGAVPIVQTNISTNAVGNTAAAGNITTAWPVPAGDGDVGTSYVLKAFATLVIGATTAETLTLGVSINGTQTPLATLGQAFNSSTLGAAYDIPLELAVNVDAIATGTPEIVLSGPLGITSANRLATNSANMPGRSSTATFNKSAANTIAIYAQWGGAGGAGQNIQTVYSKFYREGP